MNAPSAIGNAAASNVSPSSGSTRLHGRWLTLARALWIVITLMTIALFLASLPPYADYIKTICTTTSCSWQQLTLGRVVALQALGFTIDDYAAFMVAFNLIFGGVYLAVALLIFVRRSDHGLALFSSLMLVTFGLGTFANLFERLVSLYPLLWLPARTIQYIGDISLIIFFYIFPDGRFVPRWSRAASVLWVIARAFETYFPDSPLAQSRWPDLLNNAFFIGVVTSGLLAQVYRYRRVSQARERQQTKWVVFGVTVGVGTFISVILLFGVIPSLDQNIIL